MASMTQSVASGSGNRPEVVGAPEKRPSTRRDSAETLAGPTAVYDLPKAQSSDIPAHLQATFAEQERGAEYYDTYPNEWSRIRKYIQEPAAEMLGTFLLVLIGVSTACQVGLSANPAVSSMPLGIFMSIPVGFGLGQACGVWVSIGISGGHINPAVTIAMAVFRGFSWRKVPGYIFGQVLGAFIAALCIYGNYFHAIDIVEGGRSIRTVPGTASLFTGYAAPYTTDINCFFNEVLCSFILIFIIFAVTDPRNAAPPAYFIPVTLFAAIFAIASGLALNTGATVNPARDLGPRLMTAIVGYGEGVWGFRRQFWLWCNWCGPIVGGLIAGGLYDTLLYTGKGLVNRKSRAARRFELEQFVRRRMQEVPEPRSMV